MIVKDFLENAVCAAGGKPDPAKLEEEASRICAVAGIGMHEHWQKTPGPLLPMFHEAFNAAVEKLVGIRTAA